VLYAVACAKNRWKLCYTLQHMQISGGNCAAHCSTCEKQVGIVLQTKACGDPGGNCAACCSTCRRQVEIVLHVAARAKHSLLNDLPSVGRAARFTHVQPCLRAGMGVTPIPAWMSLARAQQWGSSCRMVCNKLPIICCSLGDSWGCEMLSVII
jgi:hypothetical protein